MKDALRSYTKHESVDSSRDVHMPQSATDLNQDRSFSNTVILSFYTYKICTLLIFFSYRVILQIKKKEEKIKYGVN